MRLDQATDANELDARTRAARRRKPTWQKIPRLEEAVPVHVPAARTIEFNGYDD